MEILPAGSGPTLANLRPAAAVDYELSDAALALIDGGTSANTRRAYEWQGDMYDGWCLATGRTPVPATAETLAEYVTHLANILGWAPASIRQAMAYISVQHKAEGAPLPSTKRALKALRAYSQQWAESGGKERKAPPATVDILRALVAATVPNLEGVTDPRKRARLILVGKRDRQLLTLGFTMMGRRSDVARLNLSDVSETPDGLLVYVRRSKTDQDAKGVEIAIPPALRDQTVCPVRAFRDWRAGLAELHVTEGRLVRRVDQWGNPAAGLSLDGVNRIVKRLAVKAGLPSAEDYTFHSLRSGGATAAAKAGAPASAIAEQGRWSLKSPVLHGYIRAADRWRDNAMNGVL